MKKLTQIVSKLYLLLVVILLFTVYASFGLALLLFAYILYLPNFIYRTINKKNKKKKNVKLISNKANHSNTDK